MGLLQSCCHEACKSAGIKYICYVIETFEFIFVLELPDRQEIMGY